MDIHFHNPDARLQVFLECTNKRRVPLRIIKFFSLVAMHRESPQWDQHQNRSIGFVRLLRHDHGNTLHLLRGCIDHRNGRVKLVFLALLEFRGKVVNGSH